VLRYPTWPLHSSLPRTSALCARQRELSQQEVAQKAKISVSYVSMLERGERSPPLETLAKALGVPPVDLPQANTSGVKCLELPSRWTVVSQRRNIPRVGGSIQFSHAISARSQRISAGKRLYPIPLAVSAESC
jgi:transcriptional regulator with XRE-family HTH domain